MTRSNENLPAKQGDSFALVGLTNMNLPAEFQGEIDDSDFDGFETPRETLPIVSIRQKELKDDKTGKIRMAAGGFKIIDPVAKAGEIEIADVDADRGLTISILADQTSRAMWQTGNFDRPDCKSFDGITGTGTPGGTCSLCKFSQWNGTERPLCTQMSNLLVYDHALKSCYVLRLGRSGIKPYNTFKSLLKRQGARIPVHALQVHVGTKYETDPAPHYVPNFSILGQVDIELFRQMKQIRLDNAIRLQKTAGVDTTDEERAGNHAAPRGSDPGGELPPDVTPIHDGDKESDLPF